MRSGLHGNPGGDAHRSRSSDERSGYSEAPHSVEQVLIVIGVFLTIGTLLPLLRRDEWWIRIFDFPRLQITAALALTLAAYVWAVDDLTAPRQLFIAVLAGSLLYQAKRMFPYTPLARKQVLASRNPRAESSIGLLFTNVLMTNRRAARLREIIRAEDPDVILAVETDAWWERELAEFERSHPHVVKQAQDNTYGMLLYSRLPLHDPQVKFLVQDDIPSIHTRVELPSGQKIEMRCLHPRPPAPQEADRSTERDAELLIVGKEVKAKNAPAIVLGDLNDVAWSHTNKLFHRISGLLDPRLGRGFYPTFNAHWPLIRFPLDHVFHSRHFHLIEFKRLQKCYSDHFPVFVKLSYEPELKSEQPKLHTTPEEKREAQEKIEEATGS